MTLLKQLGVLATAALLGATPALCDAARQAPQARQTMLAPTPPMGWNSWDAYAFTISEGQFKANVRALAALRRFGWDTAVIDEGWYMANPLGADLAARGYRYDGYGRLVPDVARFPSARDGKGLSALAAWTHRQGMKFGIHVVRGIPKAAVEADAPIAGSSFRASLAADKSATCPWDDANYGVSDNAAGQAYYNSMMRQYAGWGVDFVKIDCISDHPYRPTEIRQVARAIRSAGRPMILSLSPGPTNIAFAREVKRDSQMWRIMDDLWDSWAFPHPDPNSEFPNGIANAFERLAQWNSQVGPGSWPDADMLPFGSLTPHPGWGDPRQSRLTQTETRTAFALWSIARSPLILGGNLTQAPAFLRAILTNGQVIALNQGDRVSRPIEAAHAAPGNARLWVSSPRGAKPDTIAIFNVGETPLQFDRTWSGLGFPAGRWAARDLWTGETTMPSSRAVVTVAPHDVALLRLCQTRLACRGRRH
ncbi:MAG: glycoside hydrolase family 27 protein [Sphingomicrobium sp.]